MRKVVALWRGVWYGSLTCCAYVHVSRYYVAGSVPDSDLWMRRFGYVVEEGSLSGK